MAFGIKGMRIIVDPPFICVENPGSGIGEEFCNLLRGEISLQGFAGHPMDIRVRCRSVGKCEGGGGAYGFHPKERMGISVYVAEVLVCKSVIGQKDNE